MRTVYFFEPVILDDKGSVRPLSADFWGDLHKHVKSLSQKRREIDHFGREIEGEALKSKTPSAKYFYLDRRRPGQDWPDAKGIDGKLGSLAAHGVVRSLHEPAYLLNVSGTNYVAMVRSSAGPSTSAIARWLNLVFDFAGTDEYLELRAVVNNDQLERLAKAQVASKIHVKLGAGVINDQTDLPGETGAALEAASRVGAGGAEVEMTISFGNARPTDAAGKAMVREVRDLLGSAVPFKKAQATVILEDDDGEMRVDKIDFARDRITVREQFGANEDEEPTPTVVLQGMFDAIKKFRKEIA